MKLQANLNGVNCKIFPMRMHWIPLGSLHPYTSFNSNQNVQGEEFLKIRYGQGNGIMCMTGTYQDNLFWNPTA